MVAGDRLHVPPWDVDTSDDVPRITWRARALMALECEHEAAEYHRKASERRNRRR